MSRLLFYIFVSVAILARSCVQSFEISLDQAFATPFNSKAGESNTLQFSFNLLSQDPSLLDYVVTDCASTGFYSLSSSGSIDSAVTVSFLNSADVTSAQSYCVTVDLVIKGSPTDVLATLTYDASLTIDGDSGVINSQDFSIESNQLGFTANDQGTISSTVSVARDDPTVSFSLASNTFIFGTNLVLSGSTSESVYLRLIGARCIASDGSKYDLTIVNGGENESFGSINLELSDFLLSNWVSGSSLVVELDVAWSVNSGGTFSRRLEDFKNLRSSIDSFSFLPGEDSTNESIGAPASASEQYDELIGTITDHYQNSVEGQENVRTKGNLAFVLDLPLILTGVKESNGLDLVDGPTSDKGGYYYKTTNETIEAQGSNVAAILIACATVLSVAALVSFAFFGMEEDVQKAAAMKTSTSKAKTLKIETTKGI